VRVRVRVRSPLYKCGRATADGPDLQNVINPRKAGTKYKLKY